MSELKSKFDDFCKEQNSCIECKYCDEEYCHFDFAYEQGKKDELTRIIDIDYCRICEKEFHEADDCYYCRVVEFFNYLTREKNGK